MADNEIKIVIQVATAGGKASIKDFTNTTEREMGKVGQSAKKLGASLKSYLGWAAAGAVVAKGFNRMLDKGQEYQQQLADLQAITGIAGDDLQYLADAALDSSVKTGVAAQQQIEAYKLLASNIDIATIGGVRGLRKLGEEVITLSRASGVDLATAANTAASAMNQFKFEGDESARVVNVLAAGSKEGAAEVEDLALSLKQSGTSAYLANQSIETTVAAIEILGENALKGAEAGTGLRNVLTIIQSSADKLAKYGITDLNLKSGGLAATLIKLKPLLRDNANLVDIFGRENLNAASILIQNAEAVAEMEEKVTDTNTAQEQAITKMQTFQVAQSQLANALDKELIEAFQETNGIGVDLFHTMTSIVTAVGDAIDAINGLSSKSDRIRNIAGTQGTSGFGPNAFNPFAAAAEDEAAEQLERMLTDTREMVDEVNLLNAQVNTFTSQLSDAEEGSDYFKELETKIKGARNELDFYKSSILQDIELTKASIAEKKEKGQLYGYEQEQLKELQKQLAAFNTTAGKSGEAQEEQNEQVETGGDKADEAAEKWKKLKEELEDYYDRIVPKAKEMPAPDDPLNLSRPDDIGPQAGSIDSIRNEIRMTQQAINEMGPGPTRDIFIAYLHELQENLKKVEEGTQSAGEAAENSLAAGAKAGLMLADALLQASLQGQDLLGVLGNLARQLASRTLINGLSMLLSGGAFSFGKLFGFNQGGKVIGASTGGKVYGPGTTTSDSIPARLSDREYVVNAASADAMHELLEGANSSPAAAARMNTIYKEYMRAPGYAKGGRFTSTMSMPARKPDLATIDRVIATGGSASPDPGLAMIAQKIDEQTERLAAMEQYINFDWTEFDRKQSRRSKKNTLVGYRE